MEGVVSLKIIKLFILIWDACDAENFVMHYDHKW